MLAWHKWSIIDDIFDKDTSSLVCTSLDLYLDIISENAENSVAYNYVVAKGSNILSTFWDNNGYWEATLSQDFGSGYCLNRIFIGVYQ